MAAIRSERGKNKLFDAWLTKRKKMPASAGLDIQALLIMPVQRIVRYK
jgi:regulator of sigma D